MKGALATDFSLRTTGIVLVGKGRQQIHAVVHATAAALRSFSARGKCSRELEFFSHPGAIFQNDNVQSLSHLICLYITFCLH